MPVRPPVSGEFPETGGEQQIGATAPQAVRLSRSRSWRFRYRADWYSWVAADRAGPLGMSVLQSDVVDPAARSSLPALDQPPRPIVFEAVNDSDVSPLLDELLALVLDLGPARIDISRLRSDVVQASLRAVGVLPVAGHRLVILADVENALRQNALSRDAYFLRDLARESVAARQHASRVPVGFQSLLGQPRPPHERRVF